MSNKQTRAQLDSLKDRQPGLTAKFNNLVKKLLTNIKEFFTNLFNRTKESKISDAVLDRILFLGHSETQYFTDPSTGKTAFEVRIQDNKVEYIKDMSTNSKLVNNLAQNYDRISESYSLVEDPEIKQRIRLKDISTSIPQRYFLTDQEFSRKKIDYNKENLLERNHYDFIKILERRLFSQLSEEAILKSKINNKNTPKKEKERYYRQYLALGKDIDNTHALFEKAIQADDLSKTMDTIQDSVDYIRKIVNSPDVYSYEEISRANQFLDDLIELFSTDMLKKEFNTFTGVFDKVNKKTESKIEEVKAQEGETPEKDKRDFYNEFSRLKTDIEVLIADMADVNKKKILEIFKDYKGRDVTSDELVKDINVYTKYLLTADKTGDIVLSLVDRIQHEVNIQFKQEFAII
jgi:hypothetical protein